MKVKTRKIIAAITATALIGAAVGVSAFALNNSNNSDFGFKGTYDLTAFAEEAATAEITTVNVDGVSVDATTPLVLQSTDKDENEVANYTLFLSIVDTDDMSKLLNIKVGYQIGESYYNGKDRELTNVIYSSLTLNGSTNPITAADLIDTSTAYSSFEQPMLIITEVDSAVETATLTVTGDNSTVTFSKFSGQTATANTKYGFFTLETVGTTSFGSSGMETKNSVFSFSTTKANTILKYVSYSDNSKRNFVIMKGDTQIGDYTSVDQDITLTEVGDYTIKFGTNGAGTCKVTSITLE